MPALPRGWDPETKKIVDESVVNDYIAFAQGSDRGGGASMNSQQALVEAPHGDVIKDQPPPVASNGPAVWDLVIADMRARDNVGRERYGTPLQPHNGRDALVDAYQEALDLVVYLRQAIYERDSVRRH